MGSDGFDFHCANQPRLVPEGYLEELKKHISLYPNDTNVRAVTVYEIGTKQIATSS
jgi:hypothetical protein